jgi:tripartite-type tricarboxylate transporter receptor subunit TctC
MRRGLVRIIAFALFAIASLPAPGQQKFPTKPVRFLIGFSPGSATDITGRVIGPKLSDMWGQPVIIENRSGAGGRLATEMVARATPDGHTLLLTSASFAITAVLEKNLPYDPLRDLRGVAQIGTTTGILAVAPSLGVKSAGELIALAKAKPATILFGSAGTGSGIHFTTERFNMVAGIKVVHVPYKGQPEMILDIVTGRIQYGIPGLGSSLPFIKDGRLLPLAVATAKRSPLLPNVPTLAEVLPGFERDAAHGVLAPARTPRPIVQQISRDIARVLELPDVKERMQSIAFEIAPTSSEEYDRILHNQIELFTNIAKAVGLIGK